MNTPEGLRFIEQQWLRCIILVISAVLAVSRMNMDFTNIGVDDVLN